MPGHDPPFVPLPPDARQAQRRHRLADGDVDPSLQPLDRDSLPSARSRAASGRPAPRRARPTTAAAPRRSPPGPRPRSGRRRWSAPPRCGPAPRRPGRRWSPGCRAARCTAGDLHRSAAAAGPSVSCSSTRRAPDTRNIVNASTSASAQPRRGSPNRGLRGERLRFGAGSAAGESRCASPRPAAGPRRRRPAGPGAARAGGLAPRAGGRLAAGGPPVLADARAAPSSRPPWTTCNVRPERITGPPLSRAGSSRTVRPRGR